MSESDKQLAAALAAGLGLKPGENQVEAALAIEPPRTPPDSEWFMRGPTHHFGFVLFDGTKQIAVVNADDVGAEAAQRNAKLIVRADARTQLLRHILDALVADDDGCRWGDFIKMIDAELKM